MSGRTLVGVADERWGAYASVGVTLGDERTPWAGVVNQNVLDDDAWLPGASEPVPGNRLMIWSGSLGGSLFERAPETWLPEGLTRLGGWLGRALPACRELGAALLVRPHARHVLCDAHRVGNFLKDHAGVGLALSPAAMIESDMLHDAADHIERTMETLGPVASCVILENVKPPETVSEPTRCVPLDEGMLDADELVRLVIRHTPVRTPLVVTGTPEEHRAQAARIASHA